MNQYTQLLSYLKFLGEQDEYINTITKGENLELDKINIFPMLHIEINSASFPSEGTIIFTVVLTCLDIRDINKEVNIDKFWQNDNEVDNLNSTLASLNRIWSIMTIDFNKNNITIDNTPSLEAIIFDKKNLLDGWEMTIEVEMPNTTISLC